MSDAKKGPAMPETALHNARDQFYDALGDGVVCPCCDRFAKLYKEKLTSSMARILIWLVFEATPDQEGWVHIPSQAPRFILQSNRVSKLQMWDLVEERRNEDADRKVSGYYRPTDKGRRFASDELCVPSHVVTYNKTVLEFQGEDVGIQDALGEKFDYREIMAPVRLQEAA